MSLKLTMSKSSSISMTSEWLRKSRPTTSVLNGPATFSVSLEETTNKDSPKQGVGTVGRVKLLLKKGQKCYRPRRTGERKRKSVRGCIVNHNLSILNLVIVKKGDGEIEGLTDKQIPRRLGPKRANNIRKLFALDKSDPVTQYVVRRTIEKEGKKPKSVAPRVQRLITPVTLQRKRRNKADKGTRYANAQKAEAEYRKLLNQRAKDAKEKKKERRRSSLSKSKTSVSSN